MLLGRLKSGTNRLLLGCCSSSGFGGFCSLVRFCFGSVRRSGVGCSTGVCGCWGSCRLDGDNDNRLDWNNNRCCWLNRRHGHFFFFAASGQGESGEQGGEQNCFFHDEFSNG